MTFEEAAAVPQAAVLALQGLRDKGQIQPRQRVLISGAGGGVGSFAIQIAKSYGAEVTGVDSTEKLDMMRSLGADHVVDYKQEDFIKNGQVYDLLLDIAASRSIFDYRRALRTRGTYVMVGYSTLLVLQMLFVAPWISMTGSRKMGMLLHKPNIKDLDFIKELYESGKVSPVIDRCYPLREVPEAIRYLGEGRARGKVVITI
jgi:NADPH:quinone reductase-like Zn-dependent oxidoreductase